MSKIYQGLDLLPLDASGWNGDRPIFGELVAGVRPDLIIEVGTWKGMSAFNMAGHVRKLGLDCKIYCVDTWLGNLEFWGAAGPEMDVVHGFPRVYRQFLSNVVHLGYQDMVVPYPMTSLIGAKYFLKMGISSKLIYVDASHEEEDVYPDVSWYWKVLAPGGVMFGDDWPYYGVRPAVERFARENSLGIELRENHFWMVKKI